MAHAVYFYPELCNLCCLMTSNFVKLFSLPIYMNLHIHLKIKLQIVNRVKLNKWSLLIVKIWLIFWNFVLLIVWKNTYVFLIVYQIFGANAFARLEITLSTRQLNYLTILNNSDIGVHTVLIWDLDLESFQEFLTIIRKFSNMLLKLWTFPSIS